MANVDLIQKNKNIQEQIQEEFVDNLVKQFETDINLLHKFVYKLNIYERQTIDEFSNEKEQIDIATYINKLKQHVQAGFSRDAAIKAITMLENICTWSVSIMSPILTELTQKLDDTNQLLQQQNAKLTQQVEELRNTIEESIVALEESDKKQEQYFELLEFTKNVTESHRKLLNNEEGLNAEEERIRKILFEHDIIEDNIPQGNETPAPIDNDTIDDDIDEPVSKKRKLGPKKYVRNLGI